MDNEDCRRAIVETGLRMARAGLVEGTWGNISMRLPAGNLIAITPSGRDYASLQPQDIAVVDMQGQLREGRFAASSELPLHLAIYQRRSDVAAIMHTHSPYATACAAARRSLPPVVEDMAQMVGGAVDVAPYALPGTAELAHGAVTALAQKYAVLLANHGLIGVGLTLGEAFTVCRLVEKAAQVFIYAQLLGGARMLSDTDVSIMHEHYWHCYRLNEWGKEE